MTEPREPEGEGDWSSPQPEQPSQPAGPPPAQPPPAYGTPPPGQVPPPAGYPQPTYGAPQPGYGAAPLKVDNFLVWAILSTLCCFLPTGVVAIVFAAQVNSKLAAGDVAGAMESARKAKLWTIISLVVGLVVGVIYAMVVASSQSTV